ncbi:acetyltransferase [Candidatus Woesearchaeota archaeon]|nr:acetyltransferase [Candidatus Woesearchaeota archaeon]
MKDLYIIGTGSQARYVIDICKTHRIRGLIDIINRENIDKNINGVKVICHLDDIADHVPVKSDTDVIVAFGDNKKKEKIVEKLSEIGYNFSTIISDFSYVSKFAKIGKGCIICQNVTIQPNSNIGNHVIIHAGCVIEHDNVLGDFSNIAPGVKTGGNVEVGQGAYVYTGAVIIPKVKIGKYSIIGAGAVVLKNVADNSTVVGNPAKKIK